MYAIVCFAHNDRIDRSFVEEYFRPCPKVGGFCHLPDGSSVVVFSWHEDELAKEMQVFLATDGPFGATWGSLTEELSPEWKQAVDARTAAMLAVTSDMPPCGSKCQTCPQYRKICRGCPVTPAYLGDEFQLG